jgi:hypothetical protein
VIHELPLLDNLVTETSVEYANVDCCIRITRPMISLQWKLRAVQRLNMVIFMYVFYDLYTPNSKYRINRMLHNLDVELSLLQKLIGYELISFLTSSVQSTKIVNSFVVNRIACNSRAYATCLLC